MDTIYFTQSGDLVHVKDEHSSGSLGSVEYDLSDFEEEFGDLLVGGSWYRLAPRLQRFLVHVFGDLEARTNERRR